MSTCEDCQVRPCPGKEHGAFCTDLTGEEEVKRYHPAIIDPQGPLSCEMAALYEGRALEISRRNQRVRK